MTLVLKQARDWIERSASVLAESQQVLTELDAAIGDADHGINMERGFRKILTVLGTDTPEDFGSLFKSAGMALIGSVGGAAGPLYGTLFLRMAAEADGKAELSEQDVAAMFRRGLQGLMERGQARPGAKTMVDAWVPAVEALERACADGCGLPEAVHRMALAARGGMIATVPLQATKGRASYLGERSIGHQDPGATSSYLILQALDDVLGGR